MKSRSWKTAILLIVSILIVTAMAVLLMLLWQIKDVSLNGNNRLVSKTSDTNLNLKKESPTTTIIFGGDVMLGRSVQSNIEKYDGFWPLKQLATVMRGADITMVNLESPFRINASRTLNGSLVLRGDPEGVSSLTTSGVDLVSLANNHIPDMGLAGLKDTKVILDQNKINYVGAGESQDEADLPRIITRNGVRFGFLAYTYGVNSNSPGVYYNQTDDIDRMKQAVDDLKQKVDVVVLFCHFGLEYHSKPTPTQEQFARAAIDAGVNLVIGAHPHIPEPVENYKNSVIIYSLGNLVFDQEEIGNRNFSALAQFTFSGNELSSLSLLPYQIKHYGQPVLLPGIEDKQKVWNLFGLPTGQEDFNLQT